MAAEPTFCTKTFKLNNGYEIPAVGLGTWQGSVTGTDDEEKLVDSIVYALQNGYRLIDTAQMYAVEGAVGKAVRASGVPRSDITIVTKLSNFKHDDPAAALQDSLRDLGLDYIDVFLMHWPNAMTKEGRTFGPDESPTYVETWKAMEPLVGPKCRSIGVSNFTQKTLDVLLANATIVPAINQVEVHALNPSLRLVPYCQSKGILVMGWRTIGNSKVLTHEIFTRIAAAHGCSPAVVSLSWSVQRGVVVIPKSATKARIDENIRLVTLTDAEIQTINHAHETIGPYRLFDDEAKVVDGQRKFLGWTLEEFGFDDV